MEPPQGGYGLELMMKLTPDEGFIFDSCYKSEN